MSSPNRNPAGGIPDKPMRFLDSPDYDEAFGPQNRVYREKVQFRVDWKIPKKKKK